MSSVSSLQFENQLARIRLGDPGAINEFVAKYEQYIRRTLRFRLQRSSLQPVADSVDVCQSVMGSFLLRMTAGEYEIQTEEDLRKLLAGIAKKKFLMLARHESAQKRDRRCTESLSDHPELPSRQAERPSQRLVLEELHDAVVIRLSLQEQELFKCRSQGMSWLDIGAQVQEDPLVLRKRLSRAIERIAVELGLEDSRDS